MRSAMSVSNVGYAALKRKAGLHNRGFLSTSPRAASYEELEMEAALSLTTEPTQEPQADGAVD